MATLIKQAYLLGPRALGEVGAEATGDVLIEDGVIEAIAPSIADLPPDTDVIDGRGQFLGTGLIDLYSHSGEPGHESRETYESIGLAAASGGFTRVGLLPNTRPVVDNVSALESIHDLSRDLNCATNPGSRPAKALLMPWAAITRGASGEQLTELAELSEANALGFTDDQPLTNPVLLRRLLEYAQPLQKPIALWPCDPKLVGGGIAREGSDSLRLGLRGVSALAETTALATILECVAEIPVLVHIMRVSTARSVELIRRAKAQGLPVSASIPWHHLMFATPDLAQYDPNLRHEPPLGTPRDQQALVAGVMDGTIDAIAIDHSPYTYEEKTVAFEAAPPGAIGLELALSLLWQTFVTPGKWRPWQLWQCLSSGPAQCLGLTPPALEVGAPAELTLFDPRVDWRVTPETLHSLSSNTPWLNQSIQGKVTQSWLPDFPMSLEI